MVERIIGNRSRVLPILFLIAIVALAASQLDLPPETGKLDFRAYWSASYLLSRGEDFTDAARLIEVERELTGQVQDYAMKTWNPPMILALLLPLTRVSFDRAATFWLLINLSALGLSVMAGWSLQWTGSQTNKRMWIPLAAAVLFPSTIVALRFGQTNLLVLAGLVGFIVFYSRSLDLIAGLALMLTTIKPHLVYLTAPLILLEVWRAKRWNVLIGFALGIVVTLVPVQALRPTWFQEYYQSNLGGNLLAWATPTLTTFLSVYLKWGWLSLLGIALLPLALAWYGWRQHKLTLVELVEITVFLSVITAPFAWSYDFVLLLLPITRMWAWIAGGVFTRRESALYAGLIILIYVGYTFQRVASPSEFFFFWVPILIGSVYWWMRHRVNRCRLMDAGGGCI